MAKIRQILMLSTITCVMAAGIQQASANTGKADASGKGAATPGTITEMDYFTANQDTTITKLFKTFEQKNHGVKISRVYVAGQAYLQKVLQEATAGSLPNLLMLDNPMLPDIASTGILVPLNTLGTLNLKPYFKGSLSEGKYKGKLYALPVGNNTIALYYNKKLFKKYKISSPPKTWAQLLVDAKKLTHGSVYGFGFSAGSGSGNVSWQSEPFLWSNGGHLRTPNSASDKQTLTFFKQLVDAHAMPQSVVNWTQQDVQNEFEQGRVAMMINGPWITSQLNQTKGLDYGVAEIPVRVPKQKIVPPLGGEVFAITKSTPSNEERAFKLLQWLLNNENTVQQLDTGFGYVPAYSSAVNAVVKKDGYLKVFATEVRTARARTTYLGAKYPQVSAIWGNAVQSVITGQTSVAAAAASAQRQIHSALS